MSVFLVIVTEHQALCCVLEGGLGPSSAGGSTAMKTVMTVAVGAHERGTCQGLGEVVLEDLLEKVTSKL